MRWIKGHEGRYAVTRDGKVWSEISKRFLAQSRCNSMHLGVGIGYGRKGRSTVYVHKLVAEAYIGSCPDGMEISHKNADSTDNRVENLEYVTAQKNLACPIRARRISRGHRVGASGYRGVYQDRGKIYTGCTVNGKMKFIGTFPTKRDAALAWDNFVREHNLNRVTNQELGLL